MKVTIRQEQLEKARVEYTYQAPYKATMTCGYCSRVSTLFMMIDDDEGLITANRPAEIEHWPHDCLAIALYLCPACMLITAKWNQG